MGLLAELNEHDLLKLSVEDKKTIINEAVDMLMNECISVGQAFSLKPSKVLNDTLARIDNEKALQEKKENYELCYFLNEIMWEVRRRLDELKKDKDGL